MPSGAALLISWIVTAGVWLFVHVLATVKLLRSDAIDRRTKSLGLVPLATPYVAWKAGARVSAVLWAALAVLYVVLRAMG
ncbi:hypothetical protein [Sandaracinus amylolyticus]|uniref:Integral membrane protein n=1 Tax=Sandaracinus amylolyticus TaxID=927083 RepID=A0A0F6YIT2_9BACT|nr:hypothetical protein [Sandaracinus amylolyticus]AKF05457.1 hypothetical protein DB32_002606 [Sandaracinus amylolyticus]UJR81926.1 Hypothetical protein I5071_39910 [Sandaracinus amylolyticus]